MMHSSGGDGGGGGERRGIISFENGFLRRIALMCCVKRDNERKRKIRTERDYVLGIAKCCSKYTFSRF